MKEAADRAMKKSVRPNLKSESAEEPTCHGLGPVLDSGPDEMIEQRFSVSHGTVYQKSAQFRSRDKRTVNRPPCQLLFSEGRW
jgi:hypothetical protein